MFTSQSHTDTTGGMVMKILLRVTSIVKINIIECYFNS